jgi:hypothetical protein
MLTAAIPPTIVGVPIVFDVVQLESFFREERSLPRGAGRKRKFRFLQYRLALAERVVRVVLDYHHDALALKAREAEALYRRVEVRRFTVRREYHRYAGHFSVRLEYAIGGQDGWWSQSFHFVRDDTSFLGGLAGKLYSSRRRFYAE